MTKIVVVDKDDNVVGVVEKSEALSKGLVRRIARIFVFNAKGELFLQRRSNNVETYPNTQDQSAGGHVDEGESYDEAAKRELSEELGIEDVELKKVTKFYTEQDYGGRILREFSMLYTTQFDGDMKLSKREIMDGLLHPFVKIN